MNKYLKKYRKIVDGLIEESFSELKRKKVFVYDFRFLKGGAIAISFFFFVNGIIFGKRCRNYKGEGLKALVAHELSHILDFNNLNFFEYIWRGVFLFFNEKNVIKTEHFADEEAIRRGYAKGLYKNRLVWWDNLINKNLKIENRYLSPKEIKQYAQKIGKWQ